MSKENSTKEIFDLAFKNHQRGELKQAENLLNEILEKSPNHLPSLFLLGTLSAQIKKYQTAMELLQKAIKIKPDFVEAHNNLGNVFQELGEYQEATTSYQSAIKLNPQYAEAHYNLGTALHNIGKHHDAISCFQRAINFNPNNPKFYYNLALAEIELGEYFSAIANYKKAISIAADYTAAKYNLARLNLSTENFSEGWRDYEIRHDSDIVLSRVNHFLNLNQWNGKIFDGTLFVHGEQGIGDLILHSSMITDLYKIHPNICLTVDERLVSLFTRSFKHIDIKSYISNLNYKDNDCHIPLASLGSFLRQSIDDFPQQPKSYMVPNPEKVNYFQNILSHNKKLKIGVSWQTIGKKGLKRNISLHQMAKFLTLKGVEFINLQYGDTVEEREQFKTDYGIEILNFDDLDLMNDFEGLAALMTSCDLIITISNVTAHFAGALGKRAWVIVPIYTQWHWFHERTNSLWYPNVTLFRQQQYGKWDTIIDKIYKEIANIKNY